MITISKEMYSLIQHGTRTRSTGTKPFTGDLIYCFRDLVGGLHRVHTRLIGHDDRKFVDH